MDALLEDAFFFIDSDNLAQTHTKLYGFVLLDRVIEDSDSLPDAPPIGEDGCYVIVENRIAEDGTIKIYQDFTGSYGVFLYKDNDYFALSNSFWVLLENISGKVALTENRDYNEHLFFSSLCSISYSETPVNEIELLPRDVVVTIDCASKTLHQDFIDFEEHSVPINSEDGLNILDAWHDKWVDIFRSIAASDEFFQMDLSGGMDSRIMLGLMLDSGIDMKDVNIFSNTNHNHTHDEDLRIAKELGRRFGFEVNAPTGREDKMGSEPLPLDAILNNSCYLKLGWHRQFYYRYTHRRFHRVVGDGGGPLRAYWAQKPAAFRADQLKRCSKAGKAEQAVAQEAYARILDKSFQQIDEKFKMLGRPLADMQLPQQLYRETRNRFHFGKKKAEAYGAGTILYAPLMDKALAKLDITTTHCSDLDLIYAVIYTRYNPELLRLGFDSGRSIKWTTILRAKMINRIKPWKKPEHETPIQPLASRSDKTELFEPSATKFCKNDTNNVLNDYISNEHVRISFEEAYTPDLLSYVDKSLEANPNKFNLLYALIPAERLHELLEEPDSRTLGEYLIEAGN